MIRMNTLPAWIALFILVTTPLLSYGNLLDNSSFDSPLTTTPDATVGAGDADVWVMNNNSWNVASVSGETAAQRSSNFTRYLVQIVQNDNQTTGEVTFSYDYYSIDTNDDNIIRPQIYGTNSDTFDVGLTAGSTSELTELFTEYSVTNSIRNGASPSKTVDWTNYSTTIDLGTSGYKYLVVRFVGRKWGGTETNSDVVAIDNVTLVPEPGSLMLAMAAGVVLVVTRRHHH